MERLTPEYYYRFRCLAGACPDSCCKEWEVDVDPVSAERYRALSGPLGDRLRQVLRDDDGGTCLTIANKRCPMWRNDGLCEIQCELGHDALCATCREYPRILHDYGNFAERGLELSCPEAARLILTDMGLRFRTEEIPGGEALGYDTEAMATLRRSRAEILHFLQKDTYSIPQALAVMLLFSYEVQAELDGGEAVRLEPERALSDGIKFAGIGDTMALFNFFEGLEILTDRWKLLLKNGPVPSHWHQAHRALAQYFVCRYWLQAVSDYDLISRVKLAVTACLLVSAMDGEPVETAQLFSKEIENNPDNVEAILDGVYTSPALTDAALLGLLLSNKSPFQRTAERARLTCF